MVRVSYAPPPKEPKKGGRLRKIAKSKSFWISIAVIVAGMIIVTSSFNVQGNTSYIRTASHKHFVVSDAVAEIYQLPLLVNETASLRFTMPVNYTVHYYVSEQIGQYGLPHSKFGGNVQNNSVVNVSDLINMSAITDTTVYIMTINYYSSGTFNLTVTLVQKKPIQSTSNNLLLEIGVLTSIVGIALATVTASRALKGR